MAEESVWAGLSEENQAYVAKKGYDGPDALATAYRNLESTIGAQNRVEVPDWDNEESAAKFYNTIGRPESPDKYEFDRPADLKVDENLDKWFRTTAHKAGLTGRQAKAFDAAWNELQAEMVKQHETEMKAEAAKQEKALKLEWGSAYDAKMEAAKRAVMKFGGESAEETINKIEASGVARGEIFRLFAAIGESLTESGMVDGDTPKGFGAMTPDEAKTQIKDMMADQEFVKALFDPRNPGHQSAKERSDKLHEIAYGRAA